jgi:CRISPR-associated protein Cas5t
MGLAGAALGLPPLQAQDYFDGGEFKIGAYGTYEGKCKDTWKYDKRYNKRGFRYDPELDGSVIQKEFLIDNTFYIAFTTENEEKLKELFSVFNSPIYALTMGNSDSLAFVKSLIADVEFSKSDQLKNCMVQGDVVNEVLRLAPENMEFSISQTSEPITYDLPVRFEYKSDYGKRSVSSISTFSQINKEMKLNYEIDGLTYCDVFIPLFKL